jgi:hypothetical protein
MLKNPKSNIPATLKKIPAVAITGFDLLNMDFLPVFIA